MIFTKYTYCCGDAIFDMHVLPQMYVLVYDAWFTFAIADPPKSRRAKVSKSVRIHHSAFIAFIFVCRAKYRIKQRQNAPFSFIAFKHFSAGQTKYRIKQRNRSCFQMFTPNPKYRFKYRQNAPLFSSYFFNQSACFKKQFKKYILCSSKSFQLVSESMLQRHCFHFSLQFQIVSNTVSCHIFENAIALIVFILHKNIHHAQKQCY